MSLIEELKHHARRLHRAAERQHPVAVDLLQLQDSATAQRRHALAAIARLLGFSGWPVLTAALEARADADYGTLLCPSRCQVHWNVWSASYAEAQTIRDDHGGYLLGYRKQFVIVEDHYLRTLGLDPEDAHWDRIGRDWVRPRDVAVRNQLYRPLIHAVLEPQLALLDHLDA